MIWVPWIIDDGILGPVCKFRYSGLYEMVNVV